MASDIRKGEHAEKSVYINVGIWYEPEKDEIHMTLPRSGWFHTPVNNKIASKRGHPNLFEKLSRVLREAGVPAPDEAK